MNNNDIFDHLIAKICHDLLNPLNTAQMALESESIEYIKPAIEDLTLQIDMLRNFYRNSTSNEAKYNKLKEYIAVKNINLKIAYEHQDLATLIFWIAGKMIARSYVFVEQEAIHMQNFFINEEEIDILENKNSISSSRNILLYITKQKLLYDLKVIELGPNEWKINIKNK